MLVLTLSNWARRTLTAYPNFSDYGDLMGKNRDRISIIAAILEAAKSGHSKTRIMFAANLSFMLLEKYLNVTISAGFVRVEGSIYKLTARGEEYLKHYKLFEERYLRAQELLEGLDSERERLAQSCEQSKLHGDVIKIE